MVGFEHEILQRPAPQPGAPLFGAPRPERPRAPANPAPYWATAGSALCHSPGPLPMAFAAGCLRSALSCQGGRAIDVPLYLGVEPAPRY